MDEIFGYFPPVANPPSKLPLLTLLKQARAFGLGVVLATQNPVDLDYKGLANTGTWFIGRLQTERDKARVLEGLEGASSTAGKKFDKGWMEQTLASLGNRIFLMNNVHDDQPVIFESRWCLSYLRGPLTRSQIKALMDPRRADLPGDTRQRSPAPGPQQTEMTARPMLPPDVPQHFVPIRGARPGGCDLIYGPMLLGASEVRFADDKSGIDITHEVAVLVPIAVGPVAVDWDRAARMPLPVADLELEPQEEARFMALPPSAGKGKNYGTWKKEFGAWLYRSQKLALFKSPSSGQMSKPDEAEREFRVRLQHSGREERDNGADSLRRKYASKIAAVQEKVRRAAHQREKQQAEARASQVQAAISVGASILGAFLGRKTISATNIGRATTAIRGAGRVLKESQDVNLAEDNVTALQQQLADLEAQFKAEREALAAANDPAQETFERIFLKPSKADITVKLLALAWTPYWRSSDGSLTPAWT
jgi:hypothetical protein